MPTASSPQAASDPLRPILALLRDGRLDDAALACRRLLDEQPQEAAAWRLSSRIHQRCGRFGEMLAAARRAAQLAPADLAARLQHVECAVYCGHTRDALEMLATLEHERRDDSVALLAIAEFYRYCNRHAEAHRCCEAAVRLTPARRDARVQLAASCTTLGDLGRARELLESVVHDWPDDCDAWVNLAGVRRWTPADHHVERLESLLARAEGRPEEIPLCYALHKELEDLGDPHRAFGYLQRGAIARRRNLGYRVERDVEVLAAIERAFPAKALACNADDRGRDAIFVMGLPRSGTTLVDRILGAHPAVEDLGELRDFTFAVLRQAGSGAQGQLELVRRSAGLDRISLGQGYLDAIAPYRTTGRPRLVDKTPANALYAALIAESLPAARLVLLRRHPLDVCYAMYKTLFHAGYPFSYDLEDLGHYYVAWHRLMAHWRETLGGQLHEVHYEALVADQATVTRDLLAHCHLDFDPACLDFHRNPAPAATASAAQVREPLYRSSVGRWREHAAALEPTARILRAAGIACD